MSVARLQGAPGVSAVELAGGYAMLWNVGHPDHAIGWLAGGYLHHFAGAWSGLGSAGPLFVLPGAVTTTFSLQAGGGRRIDGTSMALARGSIGLRHAVSSVVELDASGGGTVATGVRYAEAGGGVTLRFASLRFGVTGGARAGDLAGAPWWNVRAEWRMAPWVTAAGAAGSYPADLSGYTSGHFITVGLRLTMPDGGSRPGWYGSALSHSDALRTVPNDSGVVRLTVRFPGASTLAIAGDWNEWQAQPLTRAGDGRWSVTLHLEPGVHRYSLLADGARWVLPAGVASLPDGFGGAVGIFVIGDPHQS